MCGGGRQISIPKASFVHAQFAAPRNPLSRPRNIHLSATLPVPDFAE
jgi:hypothetical protein